MNPPNTSLAYKGLEGASTPSKGSFDVENKERKLGELEAKSQGADFWGDAESAKTLLRERSVCQDIILLSKKLESLYSDAEASLELAADSGDQEIIEEVIRNFDDLQKLLNSQEFLLKMNGEHDRTNAIVEINGGSGGTEAQDWANMLYRMYIRWAERKGFEVDLLDHLPGEVAGIKSASILVKGDYAFGFLRPEQGVHRLVRISPFDSNARRHTSFASVAVTPDLDDEIKVDIDEKELRIDTYRSSGAGGQHVNKTDSAVRITHLPTGIVVACQMERSQHKNKDRAMKMLKAKLYDREQTLLAEKMTEIKGARMKIDFGSQIRSYVMQPYQLVKDLRTNHETSSVDAVMDGDIDQFIEAYLMQNVGQ